VCIGRRLHRYEQQAPGSEQHAVVASVVLVIVSAAHRHADSAILIYDFHQSVRLSVCLSRSGIA